MTSTRPLGDVRATAESRPRLRDLAAPTPLTAAVSEQMSRMPTESTGPELKLRRAMHQLGLRYRLHPKNLPGRPDIALTHARIAVFVDGCFWHGCPQHGTAPKNNSEWWSTKIAGNVARDRAKDEQLWRMGWLVIHVWEHDDATNAAAEIRRQWLARRGTRK